MIKLAIIASHPIQYYAPLFRLIGEDDFFQVKVFYLWNFGITQQVDYGFQRSLKWDIPLLDGYNYEFVPNISRNPGTHHVLGLQNPTLTQRVLEFLPDVILLTVSYNFASSYKLIWEMRNVNIPLIFRGDSHCILKKNNLKSQIKRLFIAKTYQQFSAFLYVGKANYEYFKYHSVPSHKLFFAPHAIDDSRFKITEKHREDAKKWKQELGINENNLVILFAGKFEPKKSPLDLINAFINSRLESVSLLMVGSGVLESEIQELVKRSENNNICVVPFQNQSLMPRTYATGDIFVLPSTSTSETWGLAVNEAMSMNLPIIVSSHVGCAADLVKPFENGLIFEAGNIEDLTRCLQVATSDYQRLKSWGKESHKIIASYSYERIILGLKESINAII
jgi:glycosyltransferase involved in cell wall biosynthesis